VDLRIESNSFTGSIPPEVESLHQLEFLRLGKNKMGGEVPDVFDRLTNLGMSIFLTRCSICLPPRLLLTFFLSYLNSVSGSGPSQKLILRPDARVVWQVYNSW